MARATKRTATRKPAARSAHRRAERPEAAPLSRADRVALGVDARTAAPLSSHADLGAGTARDPVGLVVGQSASRVPELVPIRHGRMLVSPFTFYRGAALPMAADLAGTPTPGLRVQLCGDAHLSNFGVFGSPSRRLVFDVNDFDETLAGPFEWDVKRLAASFAVAARDNDMSDKAGRKAGTAVGEAYRSAMRGFAERTRMHVWYAHLDVNDALAGFTSKVKAKRVRKMESMLASAHTRDSTQVLRKLTTIVDGRHRIISDPPVVVPIEEIFGDHTTAEIYDLIRDVLATYGASLQTNRAYLLEQFTLQQVARKIVGVGSVGTRAWIVLMDGGDGDDPLFLQAKEAQPSVLADYCGESPYRNQGERVVRGQRLMQAESDIFLGWTNATSPEGAGVDYYVRQLRDWKLSIPIEQLRTPGLMAYARMCGWTLARAHARSGDRIAIAAYLGESAEFDRAIGEFATVYADQNERDYAAFQDAVKHSRAEAVHGV